jgi:hypothetical protein
MDRSCVPVTATDDLVWSLPHSHRLRTVKYAALRAHASQTDPLISLVGESTYRAWWSGEYFVEVNDAMYGMRRTTRTLRMPT